MAATSKLPPIRRHLFQAALHPLSMHAHLASSVVITNARFSASPTMRKMGCRNVYDMLSRLATQLNSRIEELLSHGWRPAC